MADIGSDLFLERRFIPSLLMRSDEDGCGFYSGETVRPTLVVLS